MISWLYAQVGEEEMLMPYFMRWYAPQVDRLILLDGGMDEATREIIRPYANAEIRHCPFDNQHFDDWGFTNYLKTLYHEARGHADWVIIVDVDEFLYDKLPLREALQKASGDSIRAIQAIGCQMAAPNLPISDCPLPDQFQLGSFDHIYNKVACFDPALWVHFSVGRHSTAISDYKPVTTGMKLLHYRYFGEDYIRQRNARNFARKSKDDIATGRGYHVAPDFNVGKYSPSWYASLLETGQNVIEEG